VLKLTLGNLKFKKNWLFVFIYIVTYPCKKIARSANIVLNRSFLFVYEYSKNYSRFAVGVHRNTVYTSSNSCAAVNYEYKWVSPSTYRVVFSARSIFVHNICHVLLFFFPRDTTQQRFYVTLQSAAYVIQAALTEPRLKCTYHKAAHRDARFCPRYGEQLYIMHVKLDLKKKKKNKQHPYSFDFSALI